jgi:alkanesulfonate monooxygenase
MPQAGGSGSQFGARRVGAEAALPDPEAQAEFCRRAEVCGIESLLIDINYGKPDPMVLGLVLARASGVSRLKMMVAHRPGLMSPTLFVQQVNTFAALTKGRICLNVVAGHSPEEQRFYGDHEDHDSRYARMDEFLTICRAFWNGPAPVNFRGRFFVIEEGRLNTPFVSGAAARQPDIFLGGNSPQARELAALHATCWVRFGDAPSCLREQIAPVLKGGIAVGLRLSLIIRDTTAEARAAAAALVAGADVARRSREEKQFVRRSDSASMQETYQLARHEWLTPALWTGAVPVFGAPALALVGDPATVAGGIQELADAGVSHFILSGWPTLEALIRFGDEVLPLIRAQECRASASVGVGIGERY